MFITRRFDPVFLDCEVVIRLTQVPTRNKEDHRCLSPPRCGPLRGPSRAPLGQRDELLSVWSGGEDVSEKHSARDCDDSDCNDQSSDLSAYAKDMELARKLFASLHEATLFFI